MSKPSPSAVEELHQRAGPLRELEAVEPLVGEARGPAADHVADMDLGHLVVAHVDGAVAGVAQRVDQGVLLPQAARRG